MNKPELGLTSEELAQNQFRNENVAERQSRAKTHNAFRSPIKKMFGLEELSEKDIAHEDAIEMDKRIQERIESGIAGNRVEAINQLNLLDAFVRSPQTFVRLRNHLERSHKISAEDANSMNEIKQLAYKRLEDAAKKSVESFAIEKKVLVRDGIIEEGGQIPSSEIQQRIREVLEYALNDSARFFTMEKERLINLGLKDEVEATKISSKYKERAIIQLFGFFKFSMKRFIKERDELIAGGLVSKDEIVAIPGFQRVAAEKLEKAKSVGQREYRTLKEQLLEAGFSIDEEEEPEESEG